MRVLFTAYGAHGHVLPLIGVARALAAQGHDSLFATASNLCPLVASYGIATAEAGMTDDAAVAEARRRWPETASAPPGAWTTRMFCEIAAPAMAADLGPLVSRWRPDVVVREEGEYGGALAAAAAGLPWVTHGWGSPLSPPEEVVEVGRLLDPAWQRAGLRPREGAALYGSAVLDPCPPSLYVDPPTMPDRHVVRPSSPGRMTAATRLRSQGRPLAYVGFGTVPLFRDVSALTHAVVSALLARDFDVTVTSGSDQLKRELRAKDRERVHVERWVELPALLQLCTVVVCHGGAGTVLSALAAGLPLLLTPLGAPSQLRMSAACQTRGVGRVVVWNGNNADEIGDALSEVTSSGRIAAAAMSVAGEMAAMPDPSTAAAVLDAVFSGA